jgi:hypothetical protein
VLSNDKFYDPILYLDGTACNWKLGWSGKSWMFPLLSNTFMRMSLFTRNWCGNSVADCCNSICTEHTNDVLQTKLK